MSHYDDTRCTDCSRETNHNNLEGDVAEWYMVHEVVWNFAILHNPANFLCIGCLEKRIGRRLIPADFPDNIPLNVEIKLGGNGFGPSKRLRRRMGRIGGYCAQSAIKRC